MDAGTAECYKNPLFNLTNHTITQKYASTNAVLMLGRGTQTKWIDCGGPILLHPHDNNKIHK